MPLTDNPEREYSVEALKTGYEDCIAPHGNDMDG